MLTIKSSILTLFIVAFLGLFSNAQVNQGGTPPSFDLRALSKEINTIILTKPDIFKSETPAPDKGFEPPELGPIMDVRISLAEEGTWTNLPGGSRICRLKIKSNDALALSLYYQRFQIFEEGKLFIYNASGTFVIGAFTSDNNPNDGAYATELIPGDELILEYHDPGNIPFPLIEISGVLYAYQNVSFLDISQRDFGSAGACQVNVNCMEGADWQREKRGVARILLKVFGSGFWCSGSLVNNVRQDSTPYLLTAAHCGQNATVNDYSQWIFYFNYEAAACDAPGGNPDYQSIVGSTLIAQAPDATSTGSDFKLLLLNRDLPIEYNPFFNGWDRENETSSNGVGIHHPKGDIKKISTYKEALISTAYSSTVEDPDEKYWKVVWAPTQTNHGVTEGGSSGSPLFNPDGKIVGTLSGGFSSCTNLDMPDYYGKFSYSWEDNQEDITVQLKPWLDPDQTGLWELEGFGYGNLLSASFYADTSSIVIGDYVKFYDNSSGEPDNWLWTFEGGYPGHAEGMDPGKIKYDSYGNFDVRLIISTEGLADTLARNDYVHVGANIYPIPANDFLTLNFGQTEVQTLKIELYNAMGSLVKEISLIDGKTSIFKWNISDISAGMYFLKYSVDGVENPIQKIIIS